MNKQGERPRGRSKRHQTSEARKILALLHDKSPATINARRFVFAVLVEGGNFEQTTRIFHWNDLLPPDRSYFYAYQKVLCTRIVELARRSCQNNRAIMLTGTVIGFDGSWSPRRDAKWCIVTVIDLRTKKIIAFQIGQRQNPQGPEFIPGSAQSMEIWCLERLIPLLKSDSRMTMMPFATVVGMSESNLIPITQ